MLIRLVCLQELNHALFVLFPAGHAGLHALDCSVEGFLGAFVETWDKGTEIVSVAHSEGCTYKTGSGQGAVTVAPNLKIRNTTRYFPRVMQDIDVHFL